MNSEAFAKWWKTFSNIIAPSILDTAEIVLPTVAIGLLGGFLVSMILTMYGPKGLRPNKIIYKCTDFCVNTVRSFPMLLFIVAMFPLTRLLTGTIIGTKAAIVPLSISATAFIGRLFDTRFRETDPQLIEAARSFGANDVQIFFKVIVKESVPTLVNTMTMVTVTYLGSSTIAGTVGAGGLGAVAMNYGYQSFNDQVLYTSVIILLLIVYIVQWIGDIVYKRITAKQRRNA